MAQMEPVQNPRKNELAHAPLGIVALRQKRYDEAVQHLDVTLSTYIRDGGTYSWETYCLYQHGLALEGAGRQADALARFKTVAGLNFSTVGAALVRKDALAKAGV
jgi:Flp pilus assembly protein TadD